MLCLSFEGLLLLLNLLEQLGSYLAQWALLWSLVTLVNIVAYCTYKFLCHNLIVFKC